MIEAVIFDMDGVIVDNMEMHVRAFVEMCRRYGREFDFEKFKPMAGRGNDEIMPAFLDSDLIAARGIPSLSAEKEAIYREIYAADIVPTTGLVYFLESLKERGIKCAVGSSGCKENVDFVLDSCNIRKYFDVIVNSDMVSHCKPDPEIYLTTIKLLNVQAEHAVVVEDALAGIEAASRAGIKAIGITTTIPRAELQANADTVLIINDFTELDVDALESAVRTDNLLRN